MVFQLELFDFCFSGKLERKLFRIVVSWSVFFVWHSHTTRYFQPKLLSEPKAARSLRIFLRNLSLQNFELVEGLDFPRGQLCLCQKQPCTKITFLRVRNTMSGWPGRLGAC